MQTLHIGEQLRTLSAGKTKKTMFQLILKQKYLFIMSIPLVVWLFIFAYVPLWGWVLAFFKYKPGMSFFSMEWVGLKYFIELFSDERFSRVLKNTLVMSSMQLVLASFALPVLFALFLNEIKNLRFKKTIQTVSYLPHFVSWVIVSGMFIHMLSPESGVINELLTMTGIIKEPVHFMADPKYFYWISTISESWKEVGWNAIIYISAIAGIDQELYEAATADGAGRFKRMWHITLPGIRPTILILFIITIGSLINSGFEKQFLFSNGLNIDRAEVLDLYALRYGIQMTRFSFGTAVGIFKSLIALSLVFSANFISKKLANESLI